MFNLETPSILSSKLFELIKQ